MLDTETKRRIDTARNILVGKIPNPQAQVEQITIALIYKFMSDMDAEAVELNGKRSFFTGEFKKYDWSNLLSKSIGGDELIRLYSDAITGITANPKIPALFRDIFKNAYLPYRDPETLRAFLKTINEFVYDHSERLGDAFEYLLSILGSQGDAGQFRTPRHIIDFMVEIINPKKDESILDPACGTAGFLISAYKHIIKHNSSNFNPAEENGEAAEKVSSAFEAASANMAAYKGDKLTHDERKRLTESIIGYDISPDMVRLSLVNLYLHGFLNPKISEYDTLTSEDNWNEYFDVILANPPFMSPKGGIRPHKRFSIQSNRSEVLFVDYIAEHLSPTGRAAVIVPEDIIFQSGKAYKALRKSLVENSLLAVISLPAGVFNPYSGVKTSILILDKRLAKKTDKILFVKIQNDGFDLGAQRRTKDGSELLNSYFCIKSYIQSLNSDIDLDFQIKSNFIFVTKQIIKESSDFNLHMERYSDNRVVNNSKYAVVKLESIASFITKGTTPTSVGFEFTTEGINFIKIESITETGVFIKEKFSKISAECHDKLERSKLIENDLLFSIAGAFGRVAIIPKEVLPANTNQALSIIRPVISNVFPKYLFWMLKSERIFDEIQKIKVGVAQYNISLKQVGELTIPLPPLEVQKEIVAEIEGYQKIIDGAQQLIADTENEIKNKIASVWSE